MVNLLGIGDAPSNYIIWLDERRGEIAGKKEIFLGRTRIATRDVSKAIHFVVRVSTGAQFCSPAFQQQFRPYLFHDAPEFLMRGKGLGDIEYTEH